MTGVLIIFAFAILWAVLLWQAYQIRSISDYHGNLGQDIRVLRQQSKDLADRLNELDRLMIANAETHWREIDDIKAAIGTGAEFRHLQNTVNGLGHRMDAIEDRFTQGFQQAVAAGVLRQFVDHIWRGIESIKEQTR